MRNEWFIHWNITCVFSSQSMLCFFHSLDVLHRPYHSVFFIVGYRFLHVFLLFYVCWGYVELWRHLSWPVVTSLGDTRVSASICFFHTLLLSVGIALLLADCCLTALTSLVSPEATTEGYWQRETRRRHTLVFLPKIRGRPPLDRNTRSAIREVKIWL